MVNRDPSWNKTSVTVDEVYTQRRLELWGEGFSFFDHLRLKKDIIRNYEGSNHWVGGRLDFKAGDWTLLIRFRDVSSKKMIRWMNQNKIHNNQ